MYLVSNASQETYPDNSLVNFKNRLPITITVNHYESLEISLSSIGLSTKFINVPVIPNNLPSFFISSCKDFQLQESFRFMLDDQLSSVMHELKNRGFTWHSYSFEKKRYNLEEIQNFFKTVSAETQTQIVFGDDKKLYVDIVQGINGYWLVMHPLFMKCFNINLSKTKQTDTYYFEKENGEFLFFRTGIYENEPYFGCFIHETFENDIVDFNNIRSKPSKMFEYPNVVRVVCNNISPQIFNGTYSNDLAVFCPSKNEDYSVTEFLSKQYLAISNTRITDFSIQLMDENNLPLKVLPGPATILKMELRLRNLEKKSFNVRLTSVDTKEFSDNTNAKFKVKLPSKIELGRDWRIALTSISHSNIFSTFLSDPNTKFMAIREIVPGAPKVSYIRIPDKKLSDNVYTPKELIEFLDQKFTLLNIGRVKLTEDNRVQFTFKREVTVTCSNHLLSLLGYTGKIDEKNVMTGFKVVREKGITTGDISFTLLSPININFLKPNYMIVYTNIVSESIIGGIRSKILRIVPIKTRTNENYILSDFRYKEFYELQNTEIDTIEIHLRAHDGTLINFGNQQDTIINIEFSNYLEYTS